MKQPFLMAFLVLSLAALSSANADYTDKPNQTNESSLSALWKTSDQRAEQLLRQGNAASAAQTYTDPRRKAFAQLKAGDYANAAKGFAAFDDSDAHYNRGNALARSGDLQGALSAYEAALARNSHNEDARKNRELISKELKKQQQSESSRQQSKSSQSSKPSQTLDSSKKSKQSSSNNEKDKSSSEQGKQRQAGSAQKNEQPSTASANKDLSQSSPNTPSSQSNTNAQQAATQKLTTPSQPNLNQQRADKNNATSQAPRLNSIDKTNKAYQPNQINQLSQRQQAQANNLNAGDSKNRGAANPALNVPDSNGALANTPTPDTEKRITQDLWLRQIPDDPSGLLKRKFMIEHLIKQQENQP